MYRFDGGALRVLLAHPGGPFWANRDAGAWTIPKGEFTDEDPLEAARREFEEELGTRVEGTFIALSPCRQKSGKIVHAVEGNLDVTTVRSNTFELRPGLHYPEVDRAEWFTIADAMHKINPAQRALLRELQQKLG
jgi:predicted NUDIX family NTP pyrophosphohydrolase